jgi:hypothetical protein
MKKILILSILLTLNVFSFEIESKPFSSEERALSIKDLSSEYPFLLKNDLFKSGRIGVITPDNKKSTVPFTDNKKLFKAGTEVLLNEVLASGQMKEFFIAYKITNNNKNIFKVVKCKKGQKTKLDINFHYDCLIRSFNEKGNTNGKN